jgi:hypothetical protein
VPHRQPSLHRQSVALRRPSAGLRRHRIWRTGDGGARRLARLPVPQIQAGLLAGGRALRLNTRFLDDEPGPLTVRAERLVAEGGRLLYSFAVESAGRELVGGRIAVVLRPGGAR